MMAMVGSRLLSPTLLPNASHEFARESQESTPAARMALDDVLDRTREFVSTDWSGPPPNHSPPLGEAHAGPAWYRI